MVIYHRPRSKHHKTDFLSRLKDEDTCQQFRHAVKPEELSCGGCSYCRKTHQEWSKFIHYVDTAVPLTSPTMKIQQIYANQFLHAGYKDILENKLVRCSIMIKNLSLFLKQEVPNEDEIFLSSLATKNYWINKELFFFWQ